jgi:uncharacterized protein
MRYLPHAIALALILVMPVWDYFEAARLKASTNPRKRVHWYAKLIPLSWSFAALACIPAGWPAVFFTSARSGAAWLSLGEGIRLFLIGVITAVLLTQVGMLIAMRKNEKLRAKIATALRSVYFILPVTREERWWFFFVSITAGICEEILYRGFLIHYLIGSSAHLNVTLAMIASSLIFGMAHFYQGVRGAIGSAILGMVFAVVFVLGGNLLLPMFLHTLIDARVLLMIPEGVSLAPARNTI